MIRRIRAKSVLTNLRSDCRRLFFKQAHCPFRWPNALLMGCGCDYGTVSISVLLDLLHYLNDTTKLKDGLVLSLSFQPMNKNDSSHKVANQPKAVVTPDHIPSLLQLQETQKLRIQGYTEEEAERMSKSKEPSLDEVLERIMKWQESELRRLAKLNPKRKPVKLRRTDDFPDMIEIKISQVDLPENLKWMATVKTGRDQP